ncbi:hypothetical protein D6D01_08378 [Aureobasidium pullulans]|uniref:Asl1-like glycosyl hydrolase catalytic domain-containing protein n=1 Tax=Aureobasidium pullulans TaxID=5580 RepID=A0A4S9KDB5_AURPU|nr:hypothetical protein D6D01_08378 [Aureobasidium pullulans]
MRTIAGCSVVSALFLQDVLGQVVTPTIVVTTHVSACTSSGTGLLFGTTSAASDLSSSRSLIPSGFVVSSSGSSGSVSLGVSSSSVPPSSTLSIPGTASSASGSSSVISSTSVTIPTVVPVCGQFYYGSNGTEYQVACGQTYGGKVITQQQTDSTLNRKRQSNGASFQACVASCETLPQCVASVFFIGDCTLLSAINRITNTAGALAAIRADYVATLAALASPSTVTTATVPGPTVKTATQGFSSTIGDHLSQKISDNAPVPTSDNTVVHVSPSPAMPISSSSAAAFSSQISDYISQHLSDNAPIPTGPDTVVYITSSTSSELPTIASEALSSILPVSTSLSGPGIVSTTGTSSGIAVSSIASSSSSLTASVYVYRRATINKKSTSLHKLSAHTSSKTTSHITTPSAHTSSSTPVVKKATSTKKQTPIKSTSSKHIVTAQKIVKKLSSTKKTTVTSRKTTSTKKSISSKKSTSKTSTSKLKPKTTLIKKSTSIKSTISSKKTSSSIKKTTSSSKKATITIKASALKNITTSLIKKFTNIPFKNSKHYTSHQAQPYPSQTNINYFQTELKPLLLEKHIHIFPSSKPEHILQEDNKHRTCYSSTFEYVNVVSAREQNFFTNFFEHIFFIDVLEHNFTDALEYIFLLIALEYIFTHLALECFSVKLFYELECCQVVFLEQRSSIIIGHVQLYWLVVIYSGSSSRSSTSSTSTRTSSPSSRTSSSSSPAPASSSSSRASSASSTQSTATAIPTPVRNFGKRGLAYNQANLTMPFSLDGQNSQVSWAYDWYYAPCSTPGVNNCNFNPALEFVPLLYNNDPNLLSKWPAAAQIAIDNGSTALMSFNEPDFCIAGSACMSVSTAVSYHKQYMQPFAGKALIGAPAITNAGGTDQNPMGLKYLQYFLGNCTGCTIDFINLHWYSNKYAGASYFESHVNAARAVAGGRPIWITEIGLDNEFSYTDAELQAFLQKIMPWMDQQPDVARYAYFMDSPGILINSAGNAISGTGMVYNSFTNSTTQPNLFT